jgi:hypothetical protein
MARKRAVSQGKAKNVPRSMGYIAASAVPIHRWSPSARTKLFDSGQSR